MVFFWQILLYSLFGCWDMKWNYWILCIFLHFSSAIKVKLKDLLYFFFFLILNFDLQFSWTINFSVLGFCDFAVEAWVQNFLEELGIEEAKSRCRGRPLLCITRWTVFVWLCSFVLYCNSISFWWDSHSLFCVYYVIVVVHCVELSCYYYLNLVMEEKFNFMQFCLVCK